VLVPYARAEYQYAAQTTANAVGAQYVGGLLQPVVSPDTDKSFGNFAVGASAVLPHGLSGFFNYEYVFGKQNFSESRYLLGIRYAF
jgi:outer membrane autotransporter protein